MLRRIAGILLSLVVCAVLSACGADVTPAANSNPTGAVSPQISTQPAGQTVAVGATATFTVAASGTAPLSYQWMLNGAAIAGATGATYTTPTTTAADSGDSFTCVVSNASGTVTSSAALLSVDAPPQITTQPAAQTVSAGQTATFNVLASGTALNYQWSRNGAVIAGATLATYTTAATTSGDNGAAFSVTVSNAVGSLTSSAATLTVGTASGAAPQITTQPASQSVNVGQTATFSVSASGAALTYQWNRGGAAIAGATSASYTTPVTASTDNGAVFTVVVANSAGSVTSTGATLTVNSAPQITTQPANRSVTVGQAATFTVVASGNPAPTYQWKKGGTAISGATSASYTTPVTAMSDSGSTFTVVVTNSLGSTTSTAATLTVTAAGTGTNVLTYKNDLLRSGLNSTETVLTPANVNSTTFGLLRNLAVDSYVDAQPLYVSGLSISGVSHNVVFVATENNSLYAFDSDTGVTLWHVSLNGTNETPSDTQGCSQVVPTIGITSTPVIDLSAGPNGTLFAVAMSKDQSGNYHQRLHALNLTTGAEYSGAPTEITATYGSTSFAPGQYEERAALLLLNGTIYTSYSSHCDLANYGGWIIAFSESTYAISGALNVAPGSSGAGYGNQGPAIWMAGDGPAADAAGNVYLLTANGRFETTLTAGFPSGGDYGNSFLKLSLSGASPTVADYFTMSNEVTESANDTDLGSGGLLLLPDMTDSGGTVRHLAIGAGKDTNLYVVNRDNMGKFNATSNNSQIWQYLPGVLGGGIWSTPAYFNGNLYYGPVGNNLLAFPVVNAMVAGTPSSQSPLTFAYPGTSPVVSANGTTNGIVWAHEHGSVAVLHAYDATNLATELYNSNQAAGSRDQFGLPNKFIAVTVADGKVFVASTNSVAVFGLLP
ncbi:MAG TPA: immunoglobulin domain-containing protein [Steroidobacteraceae bacterium]|nr:immunoglobulin domain-containing protein [Steroidobacteraceae bacterium]